MFRSTTTASDELQQLNNQLNKKTFADGTSTRNNDLFFSSRLTQNVTKLKSDYWQVEGPNKWDEFEYLTSVDAHRNLVAVGANSNTENLKIYELNAENTLLTHLTSISLPNIYSLKWLYNVLEDDGDEGQDDDSFEFLLTGHDKGIVNLTLIPNIRSPNFQHAEIIKRFNHEKHIDSMSEFTRLSNSNRPTSLIHQLDVTPKSWRSCSKNSMLSMYKENLFFWDTSRSSFPVLKNKVKGISSFHANPTQDGLLALSGHFGVSLFDMRANSQSSQAGLVSSFYIPHRMNLEATMVKWCAKDSNYLCSAGMNNDLTIWDIRNMKPLANLQGHFDQVTSVEWNDFNTIHSSAKDGNIIQWNLEGLSLGADSDVIKCTLKNSFNVDVTNYECGTAIPASKSQIVDTVSLDDGSLLSLDSNYLGLHSTQSESTRRLSNDTINSGLTNHGERLSESFSTFFEKPRFSFLDNREFSASATTLVGSLESSPAAAQKEFDTTTNNRSGYLQMDDLISQLNATIINNEIYI